MIACCLCGNDNVSISNLTILYKGLNAVILNFVNIRERESNLLTYFCYELYQRLHFYISIYVCSASKRSVGQVMYSTSDKTLSLNPFGQTVMHTNKL